MHELEPAVSPILDLSLVIKYDLSILVYKRAQGLGWQWVNLTLPLILPKRDDHAMPEGLESYTADAQGRPATQEG